jgi:hypothetical protein
MRAWKQAGDATAMAAAKTPGASRVNESVPPNQEAPGYHAAAAEVMAQKSGAHPSRVSLPGSLLGSSSLSRLMAGPIPACGPLPLLLPPAVAVCMQLQAVLVFLAATAVRAVSTVACPHSMRGGPACTPATLVWDVLGPAALAISCHRCRRVAAAALQVAANQGSHPPAQTKGGEQRVANQDRLLLNSLTAPPPPTHTHQKTVVHMASAAPFPHPQGPQPAVLPAAMAPPGCPG